MASTPEASAIPKRRRYAPTATKFLWAVLLMQGLLYFSGHFRWFWFNERKGYTVLIAVAATAVVLVLFVLGAVASRLIGRKSQFGLSTLLLLILVMAIPLGWLGGEIDLARRQRAAVAHIRGRGDFVSFDDQPFLARIGPNLFAMAVPQIGPPPYLERVLGQDLFHDVLTVSMDRVYDETLEGLKSLPRLRSLRITDATVTEDALKNLRGLRELRSLTIEFAPYEVPNGDAGLTHLKDLTQLEELHVRNIDATDAGLAHLRGLKRLRELTIGGRGITDQGLSHIAELKELTTLNVQSGYITDRGLSYLVALRELKSLSVYGEEITDAGLEKMQGLSRLESLDIQHTNVTDAGVETLKKFKQLTSLSLFQTKVTAEGVKRLKEELPQCQVLLSW
jgi:hypothetical protein